MKSQSYVMTSPAGTALELGLFKTREGIENLGVTTYEGVISFLDLVNHFRVEANSDLMPEDLKKQRDVDARRVNGLKGYWKTSAGPVLPEMTIFISSLDHVQKVQALPVQNVYAAILEPGTDRFICDGQGRTTFIEWLLAQDNMELFQDYTIAFKLIVTNTDNLQVPFAVKVIQQVFADYHVNLRKPNKSISKAFDTSNPLNCLLDDLLDTQIGDTTLKPLIAKHGHIRRGNLWTYDQFSSLVSKLTQLTPATARNQLEAQEDYDNVLKMCSAYLQHVISLLPYQELDSDDFAQKHESFIFTKAIFAQALGYVGRSLLDQMLVQEEVGFDRITGFDIMPLCDKEDPYWVKAKITMKDEGKIKIIKGTDRRMASHICLKMFIQPIEALCL